MAKDEKPARQTSADPRVLDAGALRALGHPLRARIYDILSFRGAQTASTLAQIMGESSGATSYHLRILARHELIRETDGGVGKERWWERPPQGITIGDPEQTPSPATRAAQQVASRELMRLQHEELIDYVVRRADDEPVDWRRAATSRTIGMRLTATQARELMEKITTVLDEAAERYFEQKGDDVRTVRLGFDVFPLEETGASS